VEDPSAEVATSLLQAAQVVTSARLTLEETLDAIAQAVRRSLPAFDHVGLSVAEAGGRLTTRAATDELVRRFDDLQYGFDEGPCVESVRGETPVVAFEHADPDERWPDYLKRARPAGLRAQLGVRIAAEEEVLGGLNLYSTSTDTIAPAAPTVAQLFAAQAAIALSRSRREEQLREAITTRKIIGQAIGLTMERYKIDEDRAFTFLVRASQTSNVKLRDIAARVVDMSNDRYDQKPVPER
jgi:GAF domain-containing protein